MTTYQDLKEFFDRQEFDRIITVADAETRVHVPHQDKITAHIPAGGVAIALDPIARATKGIYIARGKTPEDKLVVDKANKILINDSENSYTLKRVFLPPDRFDQYYNGFSNQTLWPLCHVAFERPEFKPEWYEGYKKVNEKFAEAISSEIKGKTFIWIHDYQLSLVPKLLGRHKNITLAMFWHIPWPTWEVFRIVPYKHEIIESLLTCDFLAFHRGYQARNFLETVRREFEARIDEETNQVFFNNNSTTVKNFPLGIDTDVIRSLIDTEHRNGLTSQIARNVLGILDYPIEKKNPLGEYFKNYKVIIGVDRLDYTKGLILRLQAIDQFLQKNPRYLEKVIYLGILAPSREAIPAYKMLKKEVNNLAKQLNEKYATKKWKPIHLLNEIYSRKEIINFYRRADVCLVTPRDDGMNLVSKEFVIASSTSDNPGMLILSQFAGSAIDLTSAIIVNPYDVEQVSLGIRRALEMEVKEKKRRIVEMAERLDEKNVYEWARDFFRAARDAARENRT